MTNQRIQKLIAESGFASRRGAEELIRSGRVVVNNRVVTLGDKASPEDKIYIDNKIIRSQKTHRDDLQMLLLNKPEGYITTRDDPKNRKTVFQLLPKPNHGRWISVGRLDINTSGLLLFTNNGLFANLLMHPSSQIEREYSCRVYGLINDNKIKRLRDGIKLKNETKKSAFSSLHYQRNSGGNNHWLTVVLRQGKYREVRRLWERVDCKVNKLARIRFGNIVLPSDLQKGKYVYLDPQKISSLKSSLQNSSLD